LLKITLVFIPQGIRVLTGSDCLKRIFRTGTSDASDTRENRAPRMLKMMFKTAYHLYGYA